MGDRRTIVVVGAGIAGLTAALTLAGAGFAVVLCERAPKLSEIGAGIQLSPNAGRILDRLGLGRMLAAAATEPAAIDVLDGRAGRLITSIATSTFKRRHGFPYRVIHRADLQSVLARAVSRTPAIRLELGTTFHSQLAKADQVLVRIRGADGGEVVTAAGVIGADGVWSGLRGSIAGAATPVATGRTAWRAIVPADAAGDAIATDRTTLWLGPEAHVVTYPVAQGAAINIVAIVAERWEKQGWSAPGDRASLLARFEHWSAQARAVLATPISWQKFALLTVDPAAAWVAKRLALIGDSAHAMAPYIAQGAAMAIEDAAVLADCMYGSDDIAGALLAYQRARQERVVRVAETARRTGERYHQRGVSALARNAALWLAGPRLVLRETDWIYRWQPPERTTPA